MKFLHTADLQIGARFTAFGEKAEDLRRARLDSLRRILALGLEARAEVILIAGDLFEHNEIDPAIVEATFEILADAPRVPVVILPGNHDPADGPGCIWRRRPFSAPPPHITVCLSGEALEFDGGFVLPSPITQKVSTRDPSLPLVQAAAALPQDAIRIGITHGAMAIEGKHQPNDHPVALDAATRAGLDYLALGHWHKPQVYDHGRVAMPGTPEPDQFDQSSGTVALVDIPARGRTPSITHLDAATFAWQTVALDLAAPGEPAPARLRAALADLATPPARTVLRLTLTGAVPAEQRASCLASIGEWTRDFAAVLQEDHTIPALSPSLWAALLQEHPLLAQVVADVERARLFMTGQPPAHDDEGLTPLTLDAFHALCRKLNIPGEALNAEVLDAMTALLAHGAASAIAGEGAR